MTTPRARATANPPPQLLGVLADVLAIGATGFRLEPNPPRIMVSFSTQSQAHEIDFESWAGKEMIDYIAAQTGQWKAKCGKLRLRYEGKEYDCRIKVDSRRQPRCVEVSWG